MTASPLHRIRRRTLIGVVLFGVAFAYVESAVVIYLRMIYEPIRLRYHPGSPPGELFPVLTLEQLQAAGPVHRQPLVVELGRELATLVMLASAALVAARSRGQWFAWFMIAFGVWDIFFYVWLKVCADWPSSLGQWDVLFLLPVLWAGPVIAPMLVSVSMVAAGAVLLWREAAGRVWRPPWSCWLGILAGGLLIVVAFCWDWRHLVAGNTPRAFPWGLFAAGEAIGLAAFAAGLRHCGTTPRE